MPSVQGGRWSLLRHRALPRLGGPAPGFPVLVCWLEVQGDRLGVTYAQVPRVGRADNCLLDPPAGEASIRAGRARLNPRVQEDLLVRSWLGNDVMPVKQTLCGVSAQYLAVRGAGGGNGNQGTPLAEEGWPLLAAESAGQ